MPYADKEKQREYAREWRRKNLEKKRASHTKWAENNRDKYLESKRKYYHKGLSTGKPRKPKNAWKQSNPEKRLLYNARARAKKLDLEFDLEESDVRIPDTCPVLGIPIDPNPAQRRARDNSPSIDRIDSSKGYTKDNVVVVSWRANALKKDATPDELRMLYEFYGR